MGRRGILQWGGGDWKLCHYLVMEQDLGTQGDLELHGQSRDHKPEPVCRSLALQAGEEEGEETQPGVR